MFPQKVLCLTSWFAVHKVISVEMAIRLIYSNKARVVAEYEETISSPSVTWNLPAVIQLTKQISGKKRGVKFSKINVFTRDNFSCSYCGDKKGIRELNYDHVVPRVQGGKTNFGNITTSCIPCNLRKGGRTPEQARMKLLKKPETPKELPHTPPILIDRDIPEEWRPYISSERDFLIERVG